ncbi:retropepsin-like aspartic protease family protein [Pelagibacterium xiamenense]|uniref:retropepsin-like aspartic protease family protein n=1 Tax=Pelagibacterium xiamenense TaxID=2901140 RepID=UPI001E61B8AD|nr:TIGR02281 family clan AA aspartic protease [Pelagibacterium xiamenense]MCD7059592.1 TIGR02281 family clan AA aspartic protease [Pelagibacterium xiamenense]
MLIVAIALLITIGIALAISADAGALFGLTQGETAQAIPLIVIGTLIASALIARRQRWGQVVTNLVIWVAIAGVLMLGYAYRYELSNIGQRIMGELQPGAALVDPSTGNVRITRTFGGSFHVSADINGTEIPMIFDTGASAVVLTAKDAAGAGFAPDTLRYTIPVQTANGTGYAAPVTLEEITIGNITRSNIRAFVVQDGALDTSLLGMTFLETLSRYTVSRNALEMHD